MDTTQHFDNQWSQFISNMEQMVALLENQQQHPVQQVLNLIGLCSSYSEFLDALLPYYESQLSSLRLRVAVHRRYKADFGRLDERLRRVDLGTLRSLPSTAGRQSRYAGTTFYSEGLYSLTELMRHNAPMVCDAFVKMREETSAIMQRLADLPRTYDAANLLRTFQTELAAYKNSSEGQALTLTYRRNTLSRTKAADIADRISDLDDAYAASPVTKIYRKFAGNPLEFCIQVRKGGFADDDFKPCYEYIAQRELLDELERELTEPRNVATAAGPVAVVDLNDHIFMRRYVGNAARAAALREAIRGLFDDGHDGIDTSQKNQMFVVYYILRQHNLLRNTQIPAFMEQMARWYPSLFVRDEVGRYSRSIYSEMKNWRTVDGSLVVPDALFAFVESPQCQLRQSKANAFRRKIQRAESTILKALR